MKMTKIRRQDRPPEHYSGMMSRSFYVGDVSNEEVHARFEDGVDLTVLRRKR